MILITKKAISSSFCIFNRIDGLALDACNIMTSGTDGANCIEAIQALDVSNGCVVSTQDNGPKKKLYIALKINFIYQGNGVGV